MRTIVASLAALCILAVPAAALAAGSGGSDRPSASRSKEIQDAIADCRAERGTTAQSHFRFREKYGQGRGDKYALGNCVRQELAQDRREDLGDRPEEHREAVADCVAERTALGRDAFRDKYGRGEDDAHAWRHCVTVRERQEIEADRDARHGCKVERRDIGWASFREKYGRGEDDQHALHNCTEQHEQRAYPGTSSTS